jgi:hypothetical protein
MNFRERHVDNCTRADPAYGLSAGAIDEQIAKAGAAAFAR